MLKMFNFFWLFSFLAGLSSAEYSYPHQDKDSRSEEKMIVLHSSTDVLYVISNLTGQLASLARNVDLLKKEHSTQAAVLHGLERNLISMQNDNTKQESLIQALQTNNSDLQAMVQALQRNNSKQESLIQELHRNNSDTGTVVRMLQGNVARLQTGAFSGSTYVRWGRKSCAGNRTETVYSGYAAGGYYSRTGAATNHICLAPDPLWGHYTDTVDSHGEVYGAEYEFTDSKSQAHLTGNKLHDEDVPRSVCRTPRSSVTMIPGRNACYKGWSLEYNGYLVAGDHVDASGTEYICLDNHPDVIIGGHNNANGAVLYFVEGICGSLKCPPYVNGRELTCVVCSK